MGFALLLVYWVDKWVWFNLCGDFSFFFFYSGGAVGTVRYREGG